MRPQIVHLETARFTAGNVAKFTLPAGKTDHIEWDPELPGFGVRLRSGSAFYIVQYRVGTRQRRESLGDIRKTELEQARKNARVRFAQVELGIDPRAERDKLEASQKADGLTFRKLADDYLAARERQAQRPRSSCAPRQRQGLRTSRV
jgi:Arm DNA-binding domain